MDNESYLEDVYQWIVGSSESGETRTIVNPADGTVLAVVTEGHTMDAKKAIQSARTAFYESGWWDTPVIERARLLFEVAQKLEARAAEFAEL